MGKIDVSKRYAAIIEVSDAELLAMLDFKGGTIHRAYKPREFWLPNTTHFVIEHPDLPEVQPGVELAVISPVYKLTAAVRSPIERIDPPKNKLT